MKPLRVALLQNDSGTLIALCSSLGHHFHSIHAAPSLEELRCIIAKERCEVAILDMELAPLSEIERLRRDFSGICIVCTHRLADEEMWTAALSAGAADMCSSLDTHSIVTAALRHSPPYAQTMAA